MSLINDALKRAKETQPTTSGNTRSLTITMKPVESPPVAWGPIIFVPLVVLSAIGLATFLIIKGWPSGSSIASQSNVQTVHAREPVQAMVSEPAQPPTAQPAVNQTLQVAVHPVPVPPEISTQTAPPTSPPATQTAIPASTFPELKLQGIFYRHTNPSVVINKVTLSQGDLIDGAKVVQITRETVMLQYQGESKVLTLR